MSILNKHQTKKQTKTKTKRKRKHTKGLILTIVKNIYVIYVFTKTTNE